MTLTPACSSQWATGNQDMPVGSITAVIVLAGARPSRNRPIRPLRLSDVSLKRIDFACGRPSSRMRATWVAENGEIDADCTMTHDVPLEVAGEVLGDAAMCLIRGRSCRHNLLISLASGNLAMVIWYLIERACFS